MKIRQRKLRKSAIAAAARPIVARQAAARPIAACLVVAALLGLSAIATPGAAHAQAGASIVADADATLYESVSGILANGAGDHFFVGRTTDGAIRRALIRFDLADAAAACPPASTISSASLRVRMNLTVAGDTDVSLHRVLSDWSEGPTNPPGEEGAGAPSVAGDVTWLHTEYISSFWPTPGGHFDATPSDTQTVGGVGNYVFGSTDEVDADVQGWLDAPETNFGWILIGDESSITTAKRFTSRENAGFLDRPILTINCMPGPTLTPTQTSTPTPSPTATSTPTFTPSATATATPTFTPSPTSTATPTFTPSATSTATPSPTATSTPTFTPSPTSTSTPTPSSTAPPTTPPTSTPTLAATPLATQTATAIATATPTPGPSATATSTSTASPPPTSVPTTTATATATPTGTATGTATASATPTTTATALGTPTDTEAPPTEESTPTTQPTNTPAPDGTPPTPSTASPTPTPFDTPDGTPTPDDTPDATPDGTASATPTPFGDPTATIDPLITPTGTITTSMTATLTAIPTGFITTTATLTPDPSGTEATPTPPDTPVSTPDGSATPDAEGTPAPTPDSGRTRRVYLPFALRSAALRPDPTPTPPPTVEPGASPTDDGSPTPAYTPPPVLTPIASPGCEHVLKNGSFETLDAWVRGGARLPRFVGIPVHSGRWSVLTGFLPTEPNELAWSSVWQPIMVPRDANTLRVEAWVYRAAEGDAAGDDRQLVLVYDVDPELNVRLERAPIAIVLADRSDERMWRRVAAEVPVARYRGRTLWVYASTRNDGVGGRTWMFVDDVSAEVCR